MSETNPEEKNKEASSSEAPKADISVRLDTEGKNSESLLCLNCNCLLLRPNIAFMVKIEVSRSATDSK